ncbi:MAG TPA: VCBS repeat-containing protein [Actinomycetota bacterium]|nr:VCBS repeat-containing protein [Actinomycetota bacterium]
MSPLAPGISVRLVRRRPLAVKGVRRLARLAVLTVVALGLLPVSPAAASSYFGLVPDFATILRIGQGYTTPSLWIVNHSSGPLTVTDLQFIPSCSNWDLNCAGGIADPGALSVSPTGTGMKGTGCADQIFNFAVVDPATGRIKVSRADSRAFTLSQADIASDLDICRISFTMSANRAPNHDASPQMDGIQTNQNMMVAGSVNGSFLSFSNNDTTTVEAPVRPAFRAPADFNGDGRTDIAVYRPSVGGWYQKDSGAPTFWGLRDDIPVAADYNSDGKADVTVWRPSSGQWFVKDGLTSYWGIPSDIPVPGDYDGNGQANVAIWRPSTGQWFLKDGPTYSWGISSDIPVPGDYDGDGDTDAAVWRPSSGGWYIKDGPTFFWGVAGDIPVPGDYNGDGDTDIAVYRPSTGTWWIKDQAPVTFGGDPTDVPVIGDYDGDKDIDIAIYRRSIGIWWIKDQGYLSWGGDPSDIPTPASPSVLAALRR